TAVGQAAAVLQIPAIGLNLVVVEGDDAAELRGGPGHRAGTPMPGQAGDAVILGHHSRFGAPFADLDRPKTGDAIFVEAKDGTTTEFAVTAVDRVSNSTTAALEPGTGSERRLTLVTSTGGLLSKRRLVVAASADAVGAPSASSDAPPTGT